MAIVWRLCPPAFASALDVRGNREFGARWNSPGRGVVYTSANLSLAVLETYVHFTPEQRATIPDFEAVRISVPDDAGIRVVAIDELERSQRRASPGSEFRAIGDAWLARGDHLLLQAPSVIVPEDSNIIINPAHPAMRDVRLISTRRFRFDTRLAAGY